MHEVKVTRYSISSDKLTRPCLLAVISDLHNEPFEPLLAMLEGADALLVPGDISNRYRQQWQNGIAFLKEASARLPVFFSLGNHETRQKRYHEFKKDLVSTGANILINRFVPFGELQIGGWYDPKIVTEPDMMDEFEKQEGFRLLLCHKPEQFMKLHLARAIDLAVAGHAHGGQIAICGRGFYAPGQGILPKYTRGMYGDKLIVSAGVGNPVGMPRWGNPRELLFIQLLPKEEVHS